MDREERLLAYMQEDLTVEERQRFEADLASDDQLAAEVAALRSVRAEFARQDAEADMEAGWSSFTQALDAERPVPANTNRPIRLSLAQAAGLVFASVLLWQLAAVPNLDRVGIAGYEPVTEATTGPILQVIFTADAAVGDISELLRTYDGSILEGPSALGVYRISFPDSTQMDDARAALMSRPDLATSATLE